MRMVSASISAGGMRRRVGRFMVPDGLHVWIGSRGGHVYWGRSPLGDRRVTFDRDTEAGR